MVPLTADDRPLLASGVAFEEVNEAGVWIAMLQGVPSSRVSRPVVDLLTAMNGETTLRDLHERFAASEAVEDFLLLIQRFRASGLLDGDTRPPPGRVTYRPPFTLQFATLRAPAFFGRWNRLLLPLPRRGVLVPVVVVLCLGLVAAAFQVGEVGDVLAMPVSLPGLVVVVAVLSAMTLLHESAHGLTLARFGGEPRRAGFMLYYLTPAFFVDVTDGWRLSDRRQRVAVALAGPAVHAVAAALALVTALVLQDPLIRQTLQLLAVACAAIVLVNLIPFVRFDGYIALMSALDEPNLRDRTIRDGADFLTRVLFGGPRKSRDLDRWWSVPFGLACLIAPVAMVLFALSRVAQALAGAGPAAGILVLVLETAVVIAGVALLSRALLRVLRSGVSRLRFVSVSVALLASIVVVGAVIPVPVTTTFGFVTRGDRVLLVQSRTVVEADVPESAPVLLLSAGLLTNARVGDGTVRPEPWKQTEVGLEALVPIAADGVSVPATIIAGVDVHEGSGGMPSTGRAQVALGTRSLWQTLWATGVLSPLSAFAEEKQERDEHD
ncbi:daptide biosynthesis intramembrane metalloprotease [Microbacterium paraoxydans]|uniref:daptide biosynthesis intramembrane metalloprotease n=1 Tax=Microbacterium paraoxydans TaxID=199592 RepID=UPI001CFC2D29|nr:daptide biosynthesis intramembrane metalloprotease [Microbacterium paraoxydans]